MAEITFADSIPEKDRSRIAAALSPKLDNMHVDGIEVLMDDTERVQKVTWNGIVRQAQPLTVVTSWWYGQEVTLHDYQTCNEIPLHDGNKSKYQTDYLLRDQLRALNALR